MRDIWDLATCVVSYNANHTAQSPKPKVFCGEPQAASLLSLFIIFVDQQVQAAPNNAPTYPACIPNAPRLAAGDTGRSRELTTARGSRTRWSTRTKPRPPPGPLGAAAIACCGAGLRVVMYKLKLTRGAVLL